MIVLTLFSVLASFFAICSSKLEPKIVGGSYANIQYFPHMLYLYMTCPLSMSCSGSILTQHLLITAAHCFEDCKNSVEIIVYTGSDHISNMTFGEHLSDFLMHEEYSRKTIYPDIALGFSKKPWPLSQLKRVIVTRSFAAVKWGRTAGWGIIDEKTLAIQERLKSVMQTIQPRSECRKIGQVLSGTMCAINAKKYHPSHGDSGSGLVTTSGRLIGLVSWRSARMKEVVVYTNVSYFYDWMKINSRNLYCKNIKELN